MIFVEGLIVGCLNYIFAVLFYKKKLNNQKLTLLVVKNIFLFKKSSILKIKSSN